MGEFSELNDPVFRVAQRQQRAPGDGRSRREFFHKLSGHLGFSLRFERTEDRFGYFDLDCAQIMLLEQPGAPIYAMQRPGPTGKGLHFQVEVEAIAGLLQRLQQAGIALAKPVYEAWYRGDAVDYGQREFFVSDPDGYLFRFYECIGERPATIG